METTWKILSKTQVDENTVITTIEYTFDNNEPIIIDVAHFQPQSDDDILIGIQNRAISERRDRYGIKIEI